MRSQSRCLPWDHLPLWSSDELDSTALEVVIHLDIALRGLQGSMPCEFLQHTNGHTLGGKIGEKGSPPAMA